MTNDDVGAPARLSGGPSTATNIPLVHTTYRNTANLPKEPQKGYEKIGRVTAIILVQKSSKLAQYM